MNITHSCGHSVAYGAVKDKKGTAARQCPACEHAARTAAPAPRPLYCVSNFHETGKSIIIVAKGDDYREQFVRTFKSNALPQGYRSFETRDEAFAHVRVLVERGHIEVQESDRTPEEAAAQARSFQALADEANQRVSARPLDTAKAAKLGDWSPDDEDADEALFGGH